MTGDGRADQGRRGGGGPGRPGRRLVCARAAVRHLPRPGGPVRDRQARRRGEGGGRDQRDIRGGVPQPRLLPGRHRLRGVAVHHRPPPGRRPLPAPVPPARGRAGRGGAPGPPGQARRPLWTAPGRRRPRGGGAGRRAAGRGRRRVPAAPGRPAGGPGPAGARRPVRGPGWRGARQVGGCGAGRPTPGPALAPGGDGGDRRMTEPRDNGPMGPDDDLAALAGLDLALDELAAERGRAAFLATAGGPRPGGAAWRRSMPLRLAGLAAALVVLVALPAAARQAGPGTALWPVREVGQQVRDRLADDPVRRASLRLNTAEDYIVAGTGAAEERREDMADAAEDKIKDALDALKDLSGPEVAALRARAIMLEAKVEALERQKDA